MRTGPRRLSLAALSLLAALLLAGCDALGLGGLTGDGGTSVPADPAAAVTAAADRTSQAGSSRFALTSTTSGGGQNFEVSGEGLFDYAGQRGTISMNVPGFGQTTTIIDGTTIYQQLPAEMAAQAGGSWLRIDGAAITGSQQQATGGLGSGNSDPSAAMAWLKGVSNEVTEVGQEDVRGEATTHYKVTLDLQKAAQANGADAATQELLSTVTTTSVPADVWIDGEGRLRKMSYGLDINAAGQAITSNTTVELWDFGVAVDVTPPAETEIIDFEQYMQGLSDAIDQSLGEGLDSAGVDPGTAQDLDELTRQLEEETARLREEIERAAGEG